MKRSPLHTNPDAIRAWQRQSRRPLPAQSERRADDSDRRRAIRLQVLARDGMCQVRLLGIGHYAIGPCSPVLDPHHRRKASQGGGYSLANLRAVCRLHNDALEADADLARWAHSVGLVVLRGDPEWGSLG